MSRHRGYRSPLPLETEFPHLVEQQIPLTGLKMQFALIDLWIADNVPRHRYARWGRRHDGQDIAVWAFSDATTAVAFRAQVAKMIKMTDRQAANKKAPPFLAGLSS